MHVARFPSKKHVPIYILNTNKWGYPVPHIFPILFTPRPYAQPI